LKLALTCLVQPSGCAIPTTTVLVTLPLCLITMVVQLLPPAPLCRKDPPISDRVQ
jgi:hypothetical protein